MCYDFLYYYWNSKQLVSELMCFFKVKNEMNLWSFGVSRPWGFTDVGNIQWVNEGVILDEVNICMIYEVFYATKFKISFLFSC